MDYQKLCFNTIELAKEIGQFFLTQVNTVNDADIEEKGLHNFVSYVDKTAEERIVKRLQQLLPEAGFVAEEGTSTHKGDVFNWIVDPLDGTTNFLHGVPLYSVSIALQEKNEIVMGVIYEPNLDECFYAWKGSSAYLNGQPISVTKQQQIGKALLATGFPYTDYGKLKPYMELFTWFAQHTSGLRRLGSAAMDLAYTACGRYDGFYEYGLQPWDVAAGAFIVQQAGGQVTDFKGGNDCIFGGEMLASNKVLHQPFLKAIQQYFR